MDLSKSYVRRACPGLRMSTMTDIREYVRAVRKSQSTQGIDGELLNQILTDKVKMFDKFAIAKTLSTQLISNESPTRHTTTTLTGSISNLRYDWVNEWRRLEMPRTKIPSLTRTSKSVLGPDLHTSMALYSVRMKTTASMTNTASQGVAITITRSRPQRFYSTKDCTHGFL